MHHTRPFTSLTRLAAWAGLILSLFITACAPQPAAAAESIQVTLSADSMQTPLRLAAGATVQDALQQAQITLNTLDRVDPPSYTVLADHAVVTVTRVREAFDVKEDIIPFERQTVHNEALPDGKTMLVQQGVNGLEQVTYRQVFENNKEISNTVFKTETLQEPMPEIMMVGVQKPFTPLPIPGKLAYLTGGSAWLMEKTTGNRKPIVTSGDLDGQIFSLSPKGDWLLFTRSEKHAQANQNKASESEPSANINSLWAVNLSVEGSKPISLKVNNVKLFAGWVPGRGLTITYSTVEPRTTAPGWQANNDLQLLTFSASGAVIKQETILDTNMGGLYGWWGTSFAWSPDGSLLAYARPDEVGLVDLENKALVPLTNIVPYQTNSSWAWVPGLGWAADHSVLYFVTHASKAGLQNNEASPLFDLSALPVKTAQGKQGPLISLVPQAGMFAYPIPSPILDAKTKDFSVAYLRAIFPDQSDSKRYRLSVMDRDGSNSRVIFPPEDQQGLEAQQVAWSPTAFSNGVLWLAAQYQGNIWLVDPSTGNAQAITGDGLISRVDWK